MRTQARRTSLARLGAFLLLAAALVAAGGRANGPRFFPDDPIQVDPEVLDASGVAPRDLSDPYDFLENTFFENGERADIRAVNVNTADEVPNSSWYTQRLGTATVLSIQDIIRGPYTGQPPQPGIWTIIAGKTEGITPGLTVKDPTGTVYFVKFDPPSNPEMATGAEAISTRFFWALGYNVPENYIAALRPEWLQIAEGTTIRDEYGRRRPMVQKDIDTVLARSARSADGSYRVIASKGLPGTPLGPFKYFGTRPDDPNDIQPHEHRRELRALRVFSAWLNHDDSRSINTADFLQAEGDRKIVRHYLIDFGSTLGSGSTRAQSPRAGNEYLWEARPTFITMLTLGLYVRPWVKVEYPDLPAVGRFEASYFSPERWKPEYPNPAFDNARPDDLFWGAKRVMAFSDEAIFAVAETAEFTNPEATAYVAQTLIARRDKIGRLWLNAVLPIDDLRLSPDGRLTFRNLAVEHAMASPPEHGYDVAVARFDNATGEATPVGEPLTGAAPGVQLPADALTGDFVQVEIRVREPRNVGWAHPCRAVFRRNGGSWELVGRERM